MLGKNILRKSVTSLTLVAVWCVYSMVAFAMPKDFAGEITVSGQVTVNGQAAVSNSTVISGAVITTGDNSSATISLGKTGRIEILANSSMTLRFSENSIVAVLSEGKSRVSDAAGVATTVTTKHATFIADAGQADNFMVEVECSHSHVDTSAGIVTMREGSTDKQVVAGTSATAGNMAQTGCKPCLRPNSAPGPSVGNWPWLLLLAAGVGVGLFFATKDRDSDVGGGPITVVSPTR
ncbi:MAG: hypothetical protein ABIV48_06265 [Pyrinomonadaceae bacterium]